MMNPINNDHLVFAPSFKGRVSWSVKNAWLKFFGALSSKLCESIFRDAPPCSLPLPLSLFCRCHRALCDAGRFREGRSW